MTAYAGLSPSMIERLSHTIRPGEWAVESKQPIATLLGSCVAVCLFDPVARLAGMNHFMLPQMRKQAYVNDNIELAGDACMEVLCNDMLARGASKARLQAKAFGGGNVIDAAVGQGIGLRNVRFTEQWLQRENIPLIAADFLGPWARKIICLPETGEVWCKRIASSLVSVKSVQQQERLYSESLRQPAAANNRKVELF